MRTVAANLQAAALLQNRAPYGRILIDDPRIRSWLHLDGSTPSKSRPFEAVLTNNGKIFRARNNDGTLQGHLATIGDSATFSAVTLGATAALSFGGIGLINDLTDSSPDKIDFYYIENSSGVGTTTRIKRQSSTDNGTTWGAASNVFTIQGGAQRSNARPQVSVAGWDGNGGTYEPTLFYTSYSTQKNPYLGPNLHFYDGPGVIGAAGTSYRCTLDNLAGLQVSSQILFVPQICAVKLNTTDYACILFLKNPRDRSENGLYIIFFRDGLWSNLYPIITYSNWKSGLETDFKVTSPSLAYIDDTYWLFFTHTALIGGLSTSNISRSANHFAAVRSKDLVNWSDMLILAGDNMSHDGGTFSRYDWENGVVLKSSTRLFLVGYSQLFRTGTSSLISSTASDYAAKQIDVTGKILRVAVDEPEGGAGQANIVISNSTQDYNNSTILRRGSRVQIQHGYHTSTNTDANDLETIFLGGIDTSNQQTESDTARNEISLSLRNSVDKGLIDYIAPNYYEWQSGRQFHVNRIRDYGPFIQVQGNWLLQPHTSFLTAQAPPKSAKPPIDIITINTNKVEDGFFEFKFAIRNSFDRCSIGPIIRYNSNDDFLWLVFNNAGDQTWDLLQCSNSTQMRTLLGANSRVSPAGTVPKLNRDWWVRVHFYQNKIVASARQDGVSTWSKILTYQTTGKINTGRGYVGIGAVSSSISTKNDSNSGKATGYYNTDNSGSQEIIAQKFEVPTFAGTNNAILVSFAFQCQITGSPEGQVNIKIVNDDGSGQKPADATQAGNVVATKTLQMSDLSTIGWTSNTLSTQTSLPQGGKYWLFIQPVVNNADGSNDVSIAFNDSGGDTDACTSTDSGATWTSQGGTRLLFAMGYTIKGGAATVSAFNLFTGETPKSMDYLVKQIAAKAGILDYQPNYWINDTFSNLSNFDSANAKGTWAVSSSLLSGYNSSAYGFIRCSTSTIHDGVYEFDMLLNNSSAKALFCVSQQLTGDLNTDANLQNYSIEFDPSANVVSIYTCNTGLPTNSNLLSQGTPIVDLQTGVTYHVTIQHSAWFILVYLNDILVAGAYNQTKDLNPQGYLMFGCYGGSSGTPAVKFSNFKIFELHHVKDYFVFEAGKNSQSTLEDLLKHQRAYWYGASDSKTLIYSTLNNLSSSSQATFGARLYSGRKIDDDTKWYSHIRPVGDYHADRYSGSLLDTDGLRFQVVQYTEARTDAQAYRQAAFPLRQSRETVDGYVLTAAAYPGLERNDRVTVVNNFDGVNSDYIVSSISKEIDPFKGTYDMQVQLRKFVAVDAESGV